MVILNLDDSLNTKTNKMDDLIKVREDCLCNIEEFMPIPFIKLIHCYFLFYNDKRVVIKKNGSIINLKNTFQREDEIVDIDFKITGKYNRVKLEHAFLFTEQYGDKNFHHWFFEQLSIIVYYMEVIKYFPDCKLIINKNSKLKIIQDILNLLNIDSKNLLLVDNNELYIIKNLYISTGRTFDIRNVFPYIEKNILSIIPKKTYINNIDKLYIGNDNDIKNKILHTYNPYEITKFNDIIDLIGMSREIIFDINPIIDIVYLCHNIKEKKIVLLVDNKMNENLTYINLLRMNRVDVYITEKKEFIRLIDK